MPPPAATGRHWHHRTPPDAAGRAQRGAAGSTTTDEEPPIAEPLATAIEYACQHSAREHARLCPRQVLGVRIGLALAGALGWEVPDPARRILLVAETEGCFVDGVTAATGCTVGHRTLRVERYGRIAASAIDLRSGEAYRASPRPGSRLLAHDYAPDFPDPTDREARYAAMLIGYRRMPEQALLDIVPVQLDLDTDEPPPAAGRRRPACDACGEEVLYHRERLIEGRMLCPACRGHPYYRRLPERDAAK